MSPPRSAISRRRSEIWPSRLRRATSPSVLRRDEPIGTDFGLGALASLTISATRGAVQLATNAPCPVQAYRVGERVYTTQFHPEPTPADFTERMVVYRNDGYFDAGDFDAVADRVLATTVDAPLTMLRNFASRVAI